MAALPPHLFPSLGWFVHLLRAQLAGQTVSIAIGIPYRKQADLNHYRIKGPNGVLTLTAQVARASWGLPLHQADLSFAEPWHRQHARSLTTAYRNAPFWAEYAPPYLALLQQPPARLWDLQQAVLAQLCYDLDLLLPYADPEQTQADSPSAAIAVPYYQLHGPFVSNLTVLDLLLHEGPRASLFLHRMAAQGGSAE